MKHTTLVGVALVGLCLPATASVRVSHGNGVVRYDVTIEGVTSRPVEIEGSKFAKPELRGIEGYEGFEATVGAPELPAVRIPLRGDGAITVEVDSAFEQITLDKPVVPALEPIEKLPGARRRLSRGLADGTYPEERYATERFGISDIGSDRKAPLRLVSLYPLEYTPATGKGRLYRRFSVTLRGPAPKAPASEREGLLFVVGAEFKDSAALKRYAAFKESLGYDTEMLVVEPAGRKPDEIRKRMSDWYAKRTGARNYAILVGDHPSVPGYATALVSGATDRYYASLDDANYERDIGAPDVTVGRFSVTTEAELETVVTRSMRYIAGNFADDSWLSRASLIASDDTAWVHVAERTMHYLREKYTTPFGYLGTFPRALAGGDLLFAIANKATGADVLQRLNEGRGFVTYGGHGYEGGWAGPTTTNADLQQLSHPEAIPFVTSHACHTGHYVGDSFAEAWQRNPRGSVMIWAATDADFWDDGETLQELIYDAAFKYGETDFGRINDGAMRRFWVRYNGVGRSKYFWELYNNFGDPSIAFRRGRTREAFVRSWRGNLLVTDRFGQRLEGARVALFADDGRRWIRYVRHGAVRFPGGVRRVRVVVTGADTRLPWRGIDHLARLNAD